MRNLVKARVTSLWSSLGWRSMSTKWSKRNTEARPKDSSGEEEKREAVLMASSELGDRPLSEIIKQLNKKVPDSLIKRRNENGVTSQYIPWHIVNRIMNLHAPEWSGEIRSISYTPDGKSVSVVYRVTLFGTDAEIHRESTGSASLDDTSYGDPVEKAEATAFRRACARFGLGLHLFHEDMS